MASRPVVRIVLNDVSTSLSHPVSNIRSALILGKFGLTNIAKDFLSSDCTATSVSRGINHQRRKCEVVFLDMLPDDTVKRLRAGVLYGLLNLAIYIATVLISL